jgi:DNA-binding response OmpR family regulator
MPGMSGLEMLPEVKAARPNVPVIMITAYGDEATKRKAAELGAAALLTKPIDFRLLREEIDERLQRAEIGPLSGEPVHGHAILRLGAERAQCRG